MVRAIVIILVVAGLALFLAFKYGGVASFDPTAEGEAFKAQLAPGMTWQQVAALYAPKKYSVYYEFTQKVGGNEFVELRTTAPTDFDEAHLAQRLKAGEMPHGFQFPYHFSAQCSFAVTFDQAGVLSEVVDTLTMADLLQTRK